MACLPPQSLQVFRAVFLLVVLPQKGRLYRLSALLHPSGLRVQRGWLRGCGRSGAATVCAALGSAGMPGAAAVLRRDGVLAAAGL